MSQNGKPPEGVYCKYDVMKVRPGKKIKFLCHSRVWESVDTHWYGNHSIRCPGKDVCQQCKDGVDQVWKGYMLGSLNSSDEIFVFQITPLGAYQLAEQAKHKQGLLGALILLERKGKRDNSPLTAELRGRIDGTQELSYQQLEHVVNVLYKTYSRTKAGFLHME